MIVFYTCINAYCTCIFFLFTMTNWKIRHCLKFLSSENKESESESESESLSLSLSLSFSLSHSHWLPLFGSGQPRESHAHFVRVPDTGAPNGPASRLFTSLCYRFCSWTDVCDQCSVTDLDIILGV